MSPLTEAERSHLLADKPDSGYFCNKCPDTVCEDFPVSEIRLKIKQVANGAIEFTARAEMIEDCPDRQQLETGYQLERRQTASKIRIGWQIFRQVFLNSQK